MEAGQLEKALQTCETALAKNKNWSGWYHYRVAFIYLFQGKGEEARRILSSGEIPHDIHTPEGERSIGLTYLYEGRYNEAKIALRKAAKRALKTNDLSNAIRIYIDLAKLMAVSGNFSAPL